MGNITKTIMEQKQREMTYGEKAVGLTFNKKAEELYGEHAFRNNIQD